MAKFFGGKDPFEDPFFSEPFESLFDWKNQFVFDEQPSSKKQITIEEMNPDSGDTDHAQETTEQTKQLVKKNSKKKSANKGTQRLSYKRVAYGGLNGWYYTCSEGRMTGEDGVVLAEIKEEDKTIGESLHTISKGIRDKGHSVTKKQSSGGQLNTLQTLHNLNEDELPGFEENWKDNADKYMPGWNTAFDALGNTGSGIFDWEGFPRLIGGEGGWPFPSLEYYGRSGDIQPYDRSKGATERARRSIPID